jgi:hypothetical protein
MTSACCFSTAVDPAAGFCAECGKPILRCMAWSECGGIVGEDGICTVCVSPHLLLDKGAIPNAKAGEALALPLIFSNSSPTGRPLFVTNIWTRLGDGERRVQDVDWDRLDPGQEIRAIVQTAPLQTTGRIRFDVAFTAATRFSGLFWREEQFAFVSQMELDVEAGGALVINQTINTSGQGQGSDTIYAPVRIENDPGVRRREGIGEAIPLPLVRAPRLERETGVRGYVDGPLKGSSVSRAARLVWRGFADGEAPKAGPIATPESLIRMGRANTRADGGDVDVRLLVHDAKGALDENLSLAISRRHLDLFIQSGRLCAFIAGEAGVLINDQRIAKDHVELLHDGDVIKILPRYGDQLQLRVGMRENFKVIDEIVLQRMPSLNGDGSR